MDRLNTCGWYFLIAAMAGDILVSHVLPLFYRGYSITRMSISALGNPASPVRMPFNIWMLTEGILFLLALPAIFNRFRPVSAGISIAIMVSVVLFAVGACIFTCFFSVNESKEVVTAASKIHGAGSVIGFMVFLFLPLLLAILSFKEHNTLMGSVSIASFVLAIVFFVLFVMADKPEFKGTFVDREGLWQRLNLVFMYLPLAVTSVMEIICR
ncbi:MAG: DUF998 domain-containing protein [Clostridiales bacterium]|nr:DUF998 domain-containing protein [Clostridiales bacterium]